MLKTLKCTTTCKDTNVFQLSRHILQEIGFIPINTKRVTLEMSPKKLLCKYMLFLFDFYRN
jgi:hypothetical protein